MRHCSMTSFAVEIEPSAQPRLAALALMAHLFAAAGPWLMRCPPLLATILSLAAMAGAVATIARIPGPHCRLQRLAADGSGWRGQLAPGADFLPAVLGPGTRAYAALVVVELQVGGRRLGWLLPRGAVPAADFRRLKALIRLSC